MAMGREETCFGEILLGQKLSSHKDVLGEFSYKVH